MEIFRPDGMCKTRVFVGVAGISEPAHEGISIQTMEHSALRDAMTGLGEEVLSDGREYSIRVHQSRERNVQDFMTPQIVYRAEVLVLLLNRDDAEIGEIAKDLYTVPLIDNGRFRPGVVLAYAKGPQVPVWRRMY